MRAIRDDLVRWIGMVNREEETGEVMRDYPRTIFNHQSYPRRERLHGSVMQRAELDGARHVDAIMHSEAAMATFTARWAPLWMFMR